MITVLDWEWENSLLKNGLRTTVLRDWKGAGLRYASLVKGRVVALAQKLIIVKLGRKYQEF